jgi:hypothetical protein
MTRRDLFGTLAALFVAAPAVKLAAKPVQTVSAKDWVQPLALRVDAMFLSTHVTAPGVHRFKWANANGYPNLMFAEVPGQTAVLWLAVPTEAGITQAKYPDGAWIHLAKISTPSSVR